MSRRSTFPTMILGALILSSRVFAQDQPSLGDVARQARKDKENRTTKPKMVVTDDTLPSRKSVSSLVSAIDVTGSNPQSSGGGTGDSLDQAITKFNEAEADFKRLDSMDRNALAKVALAEDCDVQFPNRSNWEDKLYAAKGQYVAHMQQVTAELKQIATEAQSWKGPDGKLDPNDPRVQGMKRKAQSLFQDLVQTDARFQQVVDEGVALAKAAKH